MAKLQIDGLTFAEIDEKTAKQIKALIEGDQTLSGSLKGFKLATHKSGVIAQYSQYAYEIKLDIGFTSV